MHVGIVMGSDSDLPVMKKAFPFLMILESPMTSPLLLLTERRRSWLILWQRKKRRE